MIITISDLDKDVKKELTSIVTTSLFKQFSTLPMEEDKVKSAIEIPAVKSSLDDAVVAYYRELTEREVEVQISVDDYKKVYMHLV